MGKPQTATQIAKWAEKQDAVSNRPKGKRLTQAEVALVLQLHKEGHTQTEIAQRLGVTQPAIHKWLEITTDSTEPAKLYLRGQALRMARNIVQKGRASDHIKALEGVNVLTPNQANPVTWQIGIKADTVQLIQSTFASPDGAVSVDMHRLSAETGSDN